MNQKLFNVLFVSALTLSTSAHALPIFSENRAIQLASGTVLYPDSEDPELVYYFPGQGILRRDSEGLPMFGITYWGLRKTPEGEITYKPNDSGAFLSFVAHLDFTPQQREEIEERIGNKGKVAVLPVQASTIELKKMGESSQQPLGAFFEEFNMARVGGQADADISVNAVLTGLGARTLVSQLKNPQVMKLDYCYKTLGLSPLFKGVVTLDWSQVYETLKSSYSAGGWFSRKEVSVTIQKLIREGNLSILINAAPESEAKYEEFLMTVANMLMNRMFKAEVSASGGAQGSGWSFSRISLDYGRSEVREKIDIHFSKRSQVFHEGCIPISISGIKDDLKSVVQSANGISIH